MLIPLSPTPAPVPSAFGLPQIKPKNVAAIRTLLEAALTSGNTMNHLWHDTFVCISQMEKLQLLNDDLVDLANAGADAGRRFATSCSASARVRTFGRSLTCFRSAACVCARQRVGPGCVVAGVR